MLTLRSAGRSFNCNGASRRDFLRVGSLAVGGLALGDLLKHEAGAGQGGAGRGKSVILYWLDGGPTHIETYDPKPDAPQEYRGPLGTIRTNVPGIQLSELLVEHAKVSDGLLDHRLQA